MAKLILCPFHKEGTPSLALYGDGYKCFGCGKYGPLSDITGVELGDLNQLPEPAEDLESAYKYIDSLPTRAIRGLTFPADEDGYFITWADKSFYKKRLFGASKAKYRNPRGHKQPVLWVRSEGNQSLVIVEGEINALSVARAVGEVDVLSPGSASQFSLKANARP